MPIQITVTGDLHIHVNDPDAIVTPIDAIDAADPNAVTPAP